MLSWETMPEFHGLDLTESFILGWSTSGDLVLDVDFCVTTDHPRYRVPTADERACFVRGRLRFPGTTKVQGLQDLESARPSVDAVGQLDWGHIDNLAQGPDGFLVEGDFGSIVVASAQPVVELEAV